VWAAIITSEGNLSTRFFLLTKTAHFSRPLFEFLAELGINNDREWFKANRDRYIADVRDPMLAFVADFGERLHTISPHYVADPRPVGGSMFRINRDIRFSKDKSPYKTNVGVHFRHEVGKEVHGPGFYMHLEPGGSFAGVGIWQPDSETLGKIRGAMVANPVKWERLLADETFSKQFEVGGDSLKRAPKGYDPDHPLIEHLKRKSHVASTSYTEEEACAPGFIDVFTEGCRTAGPFTEFLTTACGLPW
jgi:uncharacterized protein (TIGR02453 family)